ncbi:hypothetical protein DVA86_02785 [Streptomyces armeniacus]|uniref:Thiopeptide-type bacteriocin biosynthesis domain-containing protein n=1 Tax=Streptomyces armeniacus TaxID=83291 RepID=A0A345XJB8_9ACTN|nr:thiopeptide maturation pyridine synthase [Streptomyces armeniacus]AXK31734.1 hypothetical protein DVA86_02785 [Streptomyces armeniacus]
MWRSFHIHYYDTDKSGLLLDAVRPLVELISPHVDNVHYLLHWLRGPHVRINVHAEPHVFARTVLPALDALIPPYLAEHPSRARVDTAALAHQHRRLAELEQEPGTLTPLFPDNSIREAPYDSREHILGGTRAAADLLADFYAATTPLSFDMVRHVRGDEGRLAQLSFDLLIASAHGLSGGAGFRRGFVSFRSHAEAFLSWWPEAKGLRPAWDLHYVAHAKTLARHVRTVLHAVDTRPDPVGGSPFIHRWLDAAGPTLRRGAELIAKGELSMDPPGAGRSPERDEPVAELLRKSPFQSPRRPPGFVVDRSWFDQYRLVLDCTYLQLTRLGLPPVERYLLCHLAANTAEDLYGVMATDVLLPTPGELASTGGGAVRSGP